MDPRTHERHAFVMYLNPGQRDEYKRRHDAIWPELVALLKRHGISNYSIHLDPATDRLFAYLERQKGFDAGALSSDPVMRRWWDHMKDLMRTHPDGAPVADPLDEVFYLA